MASISMTPTWVFAARVHVECVKNGDSREAKEGAEKEIMRMAKLLDHFIEQEKMRGTESE
jgi:hypothetical protein